MLGRKIGRYRIVARLGEGGMGAVWKAEDPLLRRTVALKILPPRLLESPDVRQRFLREARSTAVLDHPGVATLYDAGEHDGELYIAVGYVDGETVADRVARGPLVVAEALRIAACAADALEHAHARGVIHRDVTARNIMIARDGRVVVIDFGLARLADGTTLTTSGNTFGTVAYIAPEVVLGHAAEARSDVYGLGVVLYEMLTGSLPFLTDRAEAMLYSAAHEKPEAPSARRVGLDPALDRVVLKALAKDPERRYASAAAFAADLRELAAPPTGVAETADAPAPGAAAPRTPRPARAARKTPQRRVLAVLPFEPLDPSAGGHDDALGRGLAETLSAALAHVPGLRIVTPSQTPPAGEPTDDPLESARRHGAQLALKGSLQRSGQRIRVSYSLLRASRGQQITGDHVDGLASDLLALEDELFSSVVRALQVEGAERPRRVAAPDARAAHEQYLQALGYLQRTDVEASVDGAMRLLEGLVASEGNSALVHAALGKSYLRKAEMTHDPAFTKKAEESCRVALSLDPHSPEVLATLGRLLFRTGRHDEAVDALRRSLDLRGDNPEAWLILSRVHEARGRFDEAEQAAGRLIELRPENWLGYDRLGVLHFRSGRYAQAIEDWEQAARLAPDSAMTHANLGTAHLRAGHLEDALAAYRRSVQIRPVSVAYLGLGTVQFLLGHRAEAIATFERATALTPRDPRSWANLGDTQRWTPGQEGKAAAAFDRAITLVREELEANPRDAEGWGHLAKWLAKRGQIAASLDAIRRALELAPGNVNSMAHAITVFELAGDRPRALANLKTALDSGYGRLELERDPELENLRRDPEAQRLFTDDGRNRSGKGTSQAA